MELPRDHHHSPAFSLVPWTSGDGKLCEMRRFIGASANPISVLRKSPEYTGWQRDLYKIDGVPDEASQHLEINFMKPLDTRASNALNLLLAGRDLDREKRSDWTRYVMSRMFRHPFAVNFVNDYFKRMWAAGVRRLG